jgi:anhydro-N-acetylmuramic acid kinase
LNLGGIANLTLLPPANLVQPGSTGSQAVASLVGGPSTPTVSSRHEETVRGFDCGPGNALMDAWCQRHLGQDWDEEGRWAAQGRVLQPLLARMLEEPFFRMPPPKSTGRDLFHADWLAASLDALGTAPQPVDVQATLAELTALSAAEAIRQHQPECQRLLVCGGGARNTHLMNRLQALLPSITVQTTEEAAELPVDQVEALAFAWLAAAFKQGAPGNLPAVTGARGFRRLGALYPAR